jgi:flagellar biosynthesis GTPase FlhF
LLKIFQVFPTRANANKVDLVSEIANFLEDQQVFKLDSARNPNSSQRRINILVRPAKSAQVIKATNNIDNTMSNYYFNGGSSYSFEDNELSPASFKMEPVSPASSVSSSTNSSLTGRRKRNASQASISAAEAKKKKKYEMDPTNDPAVKNAIAAKANREKHKQEFQRLKVENQELKTKCDAKDRAIAAERKEKDEVQMKYEQERRQRQEVEDQFRSFVNMFVNGQPAIPTTTNLSKTSNNNNVSLDQWDQSEDLQIQPNDFQQLSQRTLDDMLNNVTTTAPIPETLPIDEDFSNDPLMAPNYKDYELPATPEEYFGYGQHDDLDQIENRRARAFTPPGG